MNAMQNAKGGLRTPLQQLLLLEERVRQAGAMLPDAEQDPAFHGIKCVINGRHCIVNLACVAEVIDSRAVTAVPGAARWVEGVFSYRGALVPVFQLRHYFTQQQHLPPAGPTDNRPILVLRKDRKGREFNAIRVDALHGMQKFKETDLLRLAPAADGSDGLQQHAQYRLESDGNDWLLLDIAHLMERVNATPPSRNREPTESNSRR